MPVLRRRNASVILCATATFVLALSACSSSSSPKAGSPSTNSAAAPSTVAASASSGSAAPSPSASSGGTSDALTAACSAAASEGQLNFADATDTDQFQQEVAGFQSKYPSIKVNFTSQRPEVTVQKIVAEVQARHKLDIDASAMDLPSAQPLLQANLVANTDWPSLGVAPDEVLTVSGVPLVRTERTILGLGYNTTKVKASDLPNAWDELINSKWAGKVIVDPRGEYLSGLALVWGEQKTLDWYKNFLATDKPMVVKGATASLEKVDSGEALMTTSSHDNEITEQQKSGAPVAIKYLDVVPTQEHYALIMKDSPHPNAAKCFLGWWISPDGGLAAQLKYEYKGDATHPAGVPAGAKLAGITSADDATLQSKVASELAKLTPGGGS